MVLFRTNTLIEGAYVETFSMGSEVYLSDIPGVGMGELEELGIGVLW